VGRFFFIPGTIPSLPALERYAAARGVSALGPPLSQWLGFFLGKILREKPEVLDRFTSQESF